MLFCQRFALLGENFALSHEKLEWFSENSTLREKKNPLLHKTFVFCESSSYYAEGLYYFVTLVIMSFLQWFELLCQTFMLLVCTCVNNQK